MELEILVFPDDRLRNVAKPIDAVTDEIRDIGRSMLSEMYKSRGVGLAAIQVNIQKRIIVADCSAQGDEPYIMINPEVLESEGESVREEGCLSLPGVGVKVARPAKIKARYLDLDGNTQDIEADGLLAACIQHEIDHLDGKLIIDHLSPLKLKIAKRKLEKAKRAHVKLQRGDEQAL